MMKSWTCLFPRDGGAPKTSGSVLLNTKTICTMRTLPAKRIISTPFLNCRYNGSSEHMYSRNNIISDMNKKNSEYSENSEMGYYRLKPTYDENSRVSINYVIQERTVPVAEYDNSAMETLADIATKQVGGGDRCVP